MGNDFFAKGFRWACSLGVLCIVIILMVTDLLALPIKTFDTDGMPVNIEENLTKDPDRFIHDMKIDLMRGDVDSIGFLAKRLVKIRPDDSDVRAMYSIFLASKDDVTRAEQELERAERGRKETQYVLYAKAMILRLEKKYNSAINVCKKAIAMDKIHPYPWNILGRIYFDLEEYNQALASFQKAIELVPNFLPAYANLGAVSFLMGNRAKSISYFQKAIKLNPRAYSAHYGLAMVYDSVGNNALAIQELERSLQLNSNNPSALQKLGELQLKAGRYEDAMTTGQEIKNRGLKGAYEILGDAALHMGDTKEAIRYLEKAPADSLAADYVLGFCFMVEGQHKKALERMESVLRKNRHHFGAYVARTALKFYVGERIIPEIDLKNEWDESLNKLLSFTAGSFYASNENWAKAYKSWQSTEGLIRGFSLEGINTDTLAKGLKKGELKYLNLGILYYFKNLYADALSEFEKALKTNQDSILANYWAAQVCLKKGDRVKAVQFLEASTKKAPCFFASLYAIGELNFLMGKQQLATQYYQRALSVKKDAGVLIKLGLIFENSKEYQRAAKQYEEVTRLYPDLFVGYNQLAWLYAKRGVELEKAMALAQKADELQPGNASILDTIGWIYFHKKEYEKAVANTRKANGIRPNSPTILYHLGAIYYAMGNRSLAKENLEKALSISTDFKEAKEARKLLNR